MSMFNMKKKTTDLASLNKNFRNKMEEISLTEAEAIQSIADLATAKRAATRDALGKTLSRLMDSRKSLLEASYNQQDELEKRIESLEEELKTIKTISEETGVWA